MEFPDLDNLVSGPVLAHRGLYSQPVPPGMMRLITCNLDTKMQLKLRRISEEAKAHFQQSKPHFFIWIFTGQFFLRAMGPWQHSLDQKSKLWIYFPGCSTGYRENLPTLLSDKVGRIPGRNPRNKIVLWTPEGSVFAHQGAYLVFVCLWTKHILICKSFYKQPKIIYAKKRNAYCPHLLTLKGRGHC